MLSFWDKHEPGSSTSKQTRRRREFSVRSKYVLPKMRKMKTEKAATRRKSVVRRVVDWMPKIFPLAPVLLAREKNRSVCVKRKSKHNVHAKMLNERQEERKKERKMIDEKRSEMRKELDSRGRLRKQQSLLLFAPSPFPPACYGTV